MLVAYTAIIALAVLPIYSGSFSSLRRPASAPSSGDEEDQEDALAESLGFREALIFPVIAGCVLGTLYLLLKYVSQDWVNWLLNFYMLFMGFMSATQAITKLMLYLYPAGKNLPKYAFAMHQKDGKKTIDLNISVLYLFAGIASLSITGYYAATHNWIASNLIGLSFAYNGIQLLALDSFKTGMALLTGLFFYDIYFVFGTEIMMTVDNHELATMIDWRAQVAKGIEAPIKVVFPRDIIHNFHGPATMLGLGDIVLPGVYIAFALRYDLHSYHKRYPKLPFQRQNTSFDKPYFNAVFAAYAIGLLTTITVMHVFQAGQPALLYLSPACISATLATAWYKNDLREMWVYKEITPDSATKPIEEMKQS
jgi:minor histocompatibility antigen H13